APPADAMPLAQAVQTLNAAGYTDIRKIEFEKGAWEAKTIDAAGKRIKVLVDAGTGAITVKEKNRYKDEDCYRDKDRKDRDWRMKENRYDRQTPKS
ncbi:MAG: PepSY domain-containing protein, partial [Rhodospirillales bacterium]|nr:PepSY domain-containing protein [Rhodospirillales bacterium]